MRLVYAKENNQIKPENPIFTYLAKGEENKDKARLSAHSPDFKKYIKENEYKNYEIVDFETNTSTTLPRGLNELTVDVPNFITND